MNKKAKIIELASRWYASAMVSLYGIGKLTNGQFYRKGHLTEELMHKTVEQLSPFELAWTFFGYSYNYILFIGIAQLAGAAMLLFERTKILGIAILLPVFLNIVIVDIEFNVGDATVSAAFYLFLLILIAVLNRQKIMKALDVLTTRSTMPKQNKTELISQTAIVIGLLILTFFAETFLLKLVGFSRF